MVTPPRVLLTGATGYVGSRFLAALKDHQIPVRVLTPKELSDTRALWKALKGIYTVFYIDAEKMDHEFPKNFAHACEVNKVKKIVYLGTHPRRRQKVGDILLASGVRVVEFRASVILGDGSPMFEMIRAWVERLPVMVLPAWARTLTQPIAIEDVIAYLVEAISYRGTSRVFEIGGPERVSYGELMKEYARQAGRRRWVVAWPTPAPWATSQCLKKILAFEAPAARNLARDLQIPAVVMHPDALRVFRVRPRSCDQAISAAILGRKPQLLSAVSLP